MDEAVLVPLLFKAFIGIAVISVLCIIYSLFATVDEFKKSMKIMLLAVILTSSGVLVHTYAILKYGAETSQLFEFVTGHVLIMMGILALVWWSKEMENTSKLIGFGG